MSPKNIIVRRNLVLPNEGLQIVGSTHNWMALKLHSGQSIVNGVHAHLGMTIRKVVDIVVRGNGILAKRMGGMRSHAPHEVRTVAVRDMVRRGA